MDCRNCGERIRCWSHFENILRPHRPEMIGGGQGLPEWRTLKIWSHVISGHERCEGRSTCAEPNADEGSQ
jgi:hypothetical protein